jgi:hypothetical protein
MKAKLHKMHKTKGKLSRLQSVQTKFLAWLVPLSLVLAALSHKIKLRQTLPNQALCYTKYEIVARIGWKCVLWSI